jgi:hypothetical protein
MSAPQTPPEREINRRPVGPDDLEAPRAELRATHREVLDASADLLGSIGVQAEQPRELNRIAFGNPFANGVPIEHPPEMLRRCPFGWKGEVTNLDYHSLLSCCDEAGTK